MTAQVAADLRAAADVLERDGWRQGDYGSIVGCKCVFGALHYVASDAEAVDDLVMDEDDEERANVAGDVLAAHLGLRGFDVVPRWNDDPDRTAAEVIAALRAAADRAEATS